MALVALMCASCSDRDSMPSPDAAAATAAENKANSSLRPQEQLIAAIRAKNIESVHKALAAGADPNKPGSGEFPPLHVAALTRFDEAGRVLIAHQADVNLRAMREERDDSGNRVERPGNAPMHAAVAAGAVDFAKLLLDHKADINLLNGRNLTPLDMAMNNKKSLEKQELLAKTSDQMIAVADSITRNESMISLLKERNARTNQDLEEQKQKEFKGGGLLGKLPDLPDRPVRPLDRGGTPEPPAPMLPLPMLPETAPPAPKSPAPLP